MARITYRHRLQSLIDNDAISPRDRSFAVSLLGYYNRSGKLTSGRASWVKTLEDRYSPDNVAAHAAKSAPLLQRLGVLTERVETGSWSGDFVASLSGQVRGGRDLSPRQLEILARIETEHNDEALTARATFVADWKANKDGIKDIARVCASYYQPTGYFSVLVGKILNDPYYVPTLAEFNKMTKNKYAQKVLNEHNAPAKYAEGSFVTLRAGAGYGPKRDCAGKPGVVIQANARPITSAARGAKVYQILPVGRAETLYIEERYIMKARKLNR